MTTPELLELLHLTRRSFHSATARVLLRSSGRDMWGKAGSRGGGESILDVRVESPDETHAPWSPEGNWRQCAFDPNVVIPELWLEPGEDTTVAGRRAVRCAGWRRPTTHDYFVLPMIADRYELDVDLERGVLLRLSCFVGDEEALTFEILEIAFDDDAGR